MLSDGELIDAIKAILWPAGDPDNDWSSDEIGEIAELLTENGAGPGTALPVVDELKCPFCGATEELRYIEDIQNARDVIGFGEDGVTLVIDGLYATDGLDDGHNGRILCQCDKEFKLTNRLMMAVEWL